jgi:hypothetical protein
MFTLSEKIRVLNTPDELRVYDPTNTEVTTSGAIADGDTLVVDGYGRFAIDNIMNIKCRRAVPASQDINDYTVVAPTGIAIGDAIEVIVSITTDRYQAEVLTQNYIGQGRTFKFSTLPLTAVTTVAIEAAIVAGYAAWLANFPVGTPLVSITTGAAAGDSVIRVLGDLAGSLTIDRVEIRRVQQGIATQNPVSLALAANISDAFEGAGLGKFLEESIRMSTPMNTDPYANDTASTRVDIRGSYTEVTFDYLTSYEENLGTTAADWAHTSIGGPAMGGVAAMHTFTLFLNEATCLAADSAIDKLAAIALLRAAALAYLTATVTAAPLTAAEERSEVLIIADSSSVDTTAAFIA